MWLYKKFNFPIEQWTYGAEHELADWDRRLSPPSGCIINTKDTTVMNSNGIAADPKGLSWFYGGELNTIPTNTPLEQCVILSNIKRYYENVTVNHRSNLHIHIKVPKLSTTLDALKQLTYYNWANRDILQTIEPIVAPVRLDFQTQEEFDGAYKRYKRCLVSHHTVLPEKKVRIMLKSSSIKDFFEAEVPHSTKRPLWHLSPRAAVNVRQLLETDTIEFRHFPGTLDEEELLTAIEWCRDYLNAALDTGESANSLYERLYKNRTFPKFQPYVHWRDVIFNKTKHGGKLTRIEIEENIKNILESHL